MPKPAITRVSSMVVDSTYNDLNSKNNGFYAPQLTQTQITAIASSTLKNGAIVYNTTTNTFQVYQNGAWNVLNTQASFVLKRTATAVNYQVLITDIIIAVTDTSVARTITLPLVASTTTGQVFIIKDEGGQANANNITIARNGANINGVAANATINANYGVLKLYSTGTEWFTI